MDRFTLRQDVFLYLKDWDQEEADPEEVNRLLDRAQTEFQNATKIYRRMFVARVVNGLAGLSPAGSVISTTITSAGSGQTSVPTVTFSTAPSGGMRATGLAVVDFTAGTVVGINLQNPGSGYLTAPTVTLDSGGGTAATATSTIDGSPGQNLIGEVFRVENSSLQKLARTSEAKLDMLVGASWKSTGSATPTHWMLGKEGEAILRVHPPLTEGSVRVFHATTVPAMTADDDEPVIPVPYHPALPWWTVARLLAAQKKPLQERLAEALAHYQGYVTAASAAVAAMDD